MVRLCGDEGVVEVLSEEQECSFLVSTVSLFVCPGERPNNADPSNQYPSPLISLLPTSEPGYSSTFPQCHTSALFPTAVHDALNIDGMLSSGERAVRDRVRLYMVRL